MPFAAGRSLSAASLWEVARAPLDRGDYGALRAAVLHEHGATPRVDEFDEPQDRPGCALIEVSAAGLHHLDLHKASGSFYTGPPPLPSVVGTDGVGRLPDGTRAYFDATVPPYGSMAERTLVPHDALLPVADGVTDEVAAALGNTGLAAWLALAWRSGLQPGETVLVSARPAPSAASRCRPRSSSGRPASSRPTAPTTAFARCSPAARTRSWRSTGATGSPSASRRPPRARSTSPSTCCGDRPRWPP